MEILRIEREKIQLREERAKLSSKIKALEREICKWSRIVDVGPSEISYPLYLEKEKNEPLFLNAMRDELNFLKKALEETV